ncbi:hypothetical protein J3Q64DRAFT_1834358 [Phycomyces blakesleeanus]|uniref:GCS light chain n=2 Tax=Phycomyces blakesleeanus TaxID=4837 RepID=A0A162UCJ3_PHYB8|nr:hypothetical protein PHYBLDRAFT_143503 [Phycomyces blakesleeanus NRRL 1555(-)]OAD75242.1 hypothetical protein PHYBLDRAFT_143503 [Phycomyces blakesleeanus NRRL 1555(-)]|eukprot:XP_018293282.1 hypothetical protein PHYBLDRAFT_143503 [Phycomyces blakesleeanus NRRL 1555(-)]
MPAQQVPHKLSLPDLQQLVLYTGNLMRTSLASRTKELNKQPNAELVHAVDDTLRLLMDSPGAPSYRYYTEHGLLEVPDLRQSSRIPAEDRNDVQVTAKLFYLSENTQHVYPPIHVDAAVNHLQKLLGVSTIDTFLVSFAGDHSLKNTCQAWSALETYQQQGVIGRLGVSDFSAQNIDEILTNKSIKVKPSINQINVGSCCDMPKETIEHAKRNGIELLHNSDSADILSTEELSKLLSSRAVVPKTTTVTPRWVIKYHVFVQCRSVVADKGYIVMGDAL